MSGLLISPITTLNAWQDALALRYQVFVDGQDVPEEEEIDQTDLCSLHILARFNGQAVATGRLFFEADGPLPGAPTAEEITAAHVPREIASKRLPILKGPTPGDRARIGRMAVHESFHGKGFGQQLMAALEQNAWRRGSQRVLLAAQDQAQGFYSRMGYSVISDPFLDANIWHHWMEKRRSS